MATYRARQRTDGSVFFQVRYRLYGKQTATSVTVESDAHDLVTLINAVGPVRALRAYGIEPPAEPAARSAMTVAEWIRKHIDSLTGVEQYTIDKYNEHLRNSIAPTLGDIALVDLTEDDIAAWVKRMEVEPSTKTGRVVAPKTIKNRHGFLSGALSAAVDRGLITSNPAAGRRLPRHTGDHVDDEREEMRTLSRDEFDRLLAAVVVAYRNFVEFLVVSGCRWGEAVALKPSDVDRSTGTVKIRRAWKYSSKGHHVGPPKTERSRRVINVSVDLLKRLDYSGVWLFTNKHGGPVRYQAFRRGVWDKAVAAAKLDPTPTPHDLRHTCASWMIQAGVPLPVVQAHLGHESITTTIGMYTHLDRSSHAAAADVIAQLLRRA